ncbi:MAG: flagellar hook-associated protein FlgL [Hydrogenophaga sp.]|nr:flagellar hook-associated protein FlgL [Hydrogenophaga sp.]
MRISTANSYDRTIDVLQKRQSELSKLQSQLATGKRVQKASDDPVSATLSETARNRLARTEADLRSLEASRASLQQAESGLAESGELIQQVRELLVAAGNATYGPNEREDIARQLEGLRERLIGVANLKDNAGRTLFGGLGGASTPFVDTYGTSPPPPPPSSPASVVQFNGQRGQAAAGDRSLPQTLDGHAIWMEIPRGNGSFVVNLPEAPTQNSGSVRADLGEVVDSSAWTGTVAYTIEFSDSGTGMQYTVSGDDGSSIGPLSYTSGKAIEFAGISLKVEGSPAIGDQLMIEPVSSADPTDIFEVVQNAIDTLRDSNSTVRTHELGRIMTELDAGLDKVLLARGRAGEWLNRADSLEKLMGDRSADYEIEISRLEDMDLVKGISDFQTKQTGLEAALKAYAQVQRLSLFSVING